MNCPACKAPMVVLELDEVEIDYCLDCGGIWLDAGELELLMGDAAQAVRLLDSFKPCDSGGESSRKCPLCRKKMKKIRAQADDSAPMLDKCPHNEGLWFDRGELAEMLRRGGLDPDHKIVQFLAKMFTSQGEQT